MTNLPEGWTDDLNIDVAPGRTLDELVDFVLQAEKQKIPAPDTIGELVARFGLSHEDAELAWDRTLGGLVHAATGNSANCPLREKDPVAWISYQKCLREPEIIVAIRPQYASGEKVDVEPVRSNELTVILVIMGVAYLLGSIYLLAVRAGVQGMPYDLLIPKALLPFFALGLGASSVGIAAVLRWKKWGVYVWAVSWLLIWILSFSTFPSSGLVISGISSTVVLALLLRPLWAHLK